MAKKLWIYNDGGRKEAGYKGTTGDCVCRAIAIITGKAYAEVYEDINKFIKQYTTPCGRIPKSQRRKKSSARTGVNKKISRTYIQSLGYIWTPTMFVGSGCKVHLRADELPKGRLIAKLSRHITAVIDGVIHDIGDCSREGSRCVYGYWSKD